METSYCNYDHVPQTDASQLKSSSSSHCGYLLVALGIISLIGSLVAAGCLYPYLGYVSFAIGGGGVILGTACILLNKLCCGSVQLQTQDESVEKSPAPNVQLSNKESQSHEVKPGFVSVRDSTPKTKADEPQPLPSLPHLLDLKLKDSLSHSGFPNPLLEPMDTLAFLGKEVNRPEIGEAVLNKNNEFTAEELYGEKVLDNELLDIRLSDWINPHLDPEAGILEKKCHAVMNDPDRELQRQHINNRIGFLDLQIQFKERLNRINNSYSIKLRDFLPAWKDSNLRFKLMMDDELVQLKVSEIDQIDQSVLWKALGHRVVDLNHEVDGVVLPNELTSDAVKEMLLIDLSKLKASQINANPKLFPSITFLLIETQELQKITTSQLSADQLSLLFDTRYLMGYKKCFFVQDLSPGQINSCVHLIENKKLFANLSEEQVFKFDDSKMDQEIFNALFSTFGGNLISKAYKLLPKLELERIYTLSLFFSKEHWKYIGEKHTLAFDFTKIDESIRQEVFDILFSTFASFTSKAYKLLPRLELEQIYALSPLFSEEHWKYIGEQHTLAFDISRIDGSKRKEVVNTLFSTFGSFTSKASKFLPKLSVDGVDAIRQYLSEEALKYV